MDLKDALRILGLLKENYEKGWECQGRCPREQFEEHKDVNPDGEMVWRRLYIDAITTAMKELEKLV